MSKLMPYLSTDHIVKILGRYDEQTFDQLPQRIKLHLRAHDITFKRRGPADLEKLEAHSDAKEHRIMNNQRTIQDFKDKYLLGKKFLFD